MMNFNLFLIGIYALSIQSLFAMDKEWDYEPLLELYDPDAGELPHYNGEPLPVVGSADGEPDDEEVENEEQPLEEVLPEKKGERFCLCTGCPDADHDFQTRKKLYQHVAQEHFPYRVRVRQCPWRGCAVQRREKRVLINHCNARHIGYKGFKCKMCSRKFFSKHNLNVHINSFHKATGQAESAPAPAPATEVNDWAISLQQQAFLFQQQALQYGQLIQASFLANQQAVAQANIYPMPQFQHFQPMAQPQQQVYPLYNQNQQMIAQPQNIEHFPNQQALAQPDAYPMQQFQHFQPMAQPQQQVYPLYDQNQQMIAQPQNVQYFPIQPGPLHVETVREEPLAQIPQSISTTTTAPALPRRYRCQMHGCDQEFDGQDSWILHISRQHYLTCRFKNCQEGPFATLDALMRHIDLRH